jgi:CNT family concentrative nucleoside transporter
VLQLRAAFGFIVLLALAWLLLGSRRRFPWKVVIGGTLLQVALAAFVLRTPVGEAIFQQVGRLVTVMIEASDAGAAFVFGNLVRPDDDRWGFVFAAKALPTIIVFSSLSAVGFHFGILQRIVGTMAIVMTRFMGVSGAESLCAAANVFLGQTEAPLFVRPYIPHMTRSELNAVMVGGFATIAGSLIAVYAQMLGHEDAEQTAAMARHLLAASLIAAPASLVVAKVMLPETEPSDTAGTVKLRVERTSRNVIDAAASGALEGLKLALNVGAMLIAFIALVYLIDAVLEQVGRIPFVHGGLAAIGLQPLRLDAILGLLFAPVAWLISVEVGELRVFGSLLGKAMAANEFLAYKSLAELMRDGAISERGRTLAIYALCGFANFSSIAIQIAGIGGMAPARAGELAQLGLRAMLGGAVACWMTASVAGAFT